MEKSYQGKFILFLTIFIISLLSITDLVRAQAEERSSEIIWDEWGVPHIYASDSEQLFYGFGWAQMKSHGNLILKLYGEASGKAAELWGESFLSDDKMIHVMDVPNRARSWYRELPRESKKLLDAFVAGMNAYAEQHPKAVADTLDSLLPIEPALVLSHMQKAIHMTFMAGNPERTVFKWKSRLGSNGWAIGPSKSATGNAMLLINPHLPWSGLFRWYEVNLNINEQKMYGATLVGAPLMAIGFNQNLGWTHTVNTINNIDYYELTLTDSGYEWDGETRTFDHDTITVKVKQADDTFENEEIAVIRSVHGPVISRKGENALAVRVAGLDQPNLIGQYWKMIQAQNLQEFENALQELQMPMFNVIYADKDGNIMYLFNGRVPLRPTGLGDWNYWSGFIPGNTSESLWSETHPYEDLPRIVNPPSGWVQNTNDPPWSATMPRVLDPDDFPSYMAPREFGLRTQQSINMLKNDESITFQELVDYKHSTHLLLADRLLDDLWEITESHGSNGYSEAINTLQTWDRKAENDSRGTVLFYYWIKELGSDYFATPWSSDKPLTTPNGLRDSTKALKALTRASKKVKERFGRLDVTWGEVNRLQKGETEYPSNGTEGSFGAFRVSWHNDLDADEKYENIGGDSFYGIVEFSDSLKAEMLLPYGNATQSSMPSFNDQLKLYSEKKLRPILFSYDKIKQGMVEQEVLDTYED